MHQLQELIAQRVVSGLQRKATTTPSRWACNYRMMGAPFAGKWRFDHHPWLKEMHETEAERNVGQKCAQVGYTEWMMNMCFYGIDIEGVDVLYVLPTDRDAGEFSAGRFDPALELSPHLREMFSNVKNVGHKRAGQASLYVRGSRSRSQLKSIPAAILAFDEVDEMLQDNIPLAEERSSGQIYKRNFKVSTPTFEGFGINQYYEESTKEHFFFRCPHCDKLTELVFPECLEITAEDKADPKIRDSYIKCRECQKELKHEEKAEWLATGRFVAEYPDRYTRGFYVNQLYSAAVRPYELATAFLKSLLDPTSEQEFYNSKMGVPHIVADARVDDVMFNACIGNYKKGSTAQSPVITMGVDQGRKIHAVVNEWRLPTRRTPGLDINEEAKPRVLDEQILDEWSQLDNLMHNWRVQGCVVDRHPEARNARAFATRFYGRVLLCMYGRGLTGKHVQLGTDEERTITVDRTAWLDQSLGRFKNRTVSLPIDVSKDFRKQIKEPVRVYDQDADGNPVGKYKNANADHFAHAFNYAEIALPLALGSGRHQDIAGVL